MAWMIVSAVLLTALLVVALLWMKTRKAAGELREAAKAAAAEAATKTKEMQVLQRKTAELEALTYLPVFSTQCVYKLLAKGEIEVAGGTKTHGLVQMESGVLKPFLVSESMTHLTVEDCFSPVRGQLVKLGPGVFGISAPVQPPGGADADATVASAEVHAFQEPPESTGAAIGFEVEDASDRTVMYAPDHHQPQIPTDPNAGLPYLKVVEGNDQGTLFHLPFGEATVGREKSNTVALNDKGSSRVHCKITFFNHRFVLRDNHSTNGTRCNGERITEKFLEFGDTLRVADTHMIFTCKGDELKDQDPDGAIAAFEATLKRAPEFLTALKVQAFLLERNIARQKEAVPLWSKIMELEKSAG